MLEDIKKEINSQYAKGYIAEHTKITIEKILDKYNNQEEYLIVDRKECYCMERIYAEQYKKAWEELIILKCVRNNVDDKNYPFIIGNYYLMESISIGQSRSTVMVEGKAYNSILFDYYKIINDKLVEFDIYRSEYSPYYRRLGE